MKIVMMKNQEMLLVEVLSILIIMEETAAKINIIMMKTTNHLETTNSILMITLRQQRDLVIQIKIGADMIDTVEIVAVKGIETTARAVVQENMIRISLLLDLRGKLLAQTLSQEVIPMEVVELQTHLALQIHTVWVDKIPMVMVVVDQTPMAMVVVDTVMEVMDQALMEMVDQDLMVEVLDVEVSLKSVAPQQNK